MRKSYQGACHCGQVQFEVTADIDHVRVCDCSICRKRGALNFRVEEPDFVLKTPLDKLTVYEWGSHTAKDYFCKTCGILPFRKPSHPSPEELEKNVPLFTGWAINVRCLDAIDFTMLPQMPIHGSRLRLREV